MASSFFERYSELCKAAGETPNSVAKTIGASSGSVTAWKNGTEPRYSTIVKIADYFNVSVGYLSGNEEKTPTLTEKDRRNDVNILRIAGRDGSYQERHLTDEQMAALKAILAQMPDAPEDL